MIHEQKSPSFKVKASVMKKKDALIRQVASLEGNDLEVFCYFRASVYLTSFQCGIIDIFSTTDFLLDMYRQTCLKQSSTGQSNLSKTILYGTVKPV